MPGPAGLRRLPVQPLGIQLWLADLDSPVDDADHWLDEAEQARAARFVFEADRRRYRAAHVAMRWVLAQRFRLPPRAALALGPHGKPRLPGPATGSFNLSHAGGWALIGARTGGEIGVDLELLRPIDDLDGMSRHHLAREELDELSAAPDAEAANRAFLSGWTRKEACVKALGSGLSVAPDTFAAGLGDAPRELIIHFEDREVPVRVASVFVGAGMLAAVAEVIDPDRDNRLEQ